MTIDKEDFESIADEIFHTLPETIRAKIDNVHIVVEDLPGSESLKKVGIRSNNMLLGLYEGIPLNRRGTAYGMYPVVPDKITLFKKNIVYV